MPKFQEITRWRKKMGWTQAQLGQKLGRHQVIVSDWEKGARPIPLDALEQLRALGYDGPAAAAEESPLTRAEFEAFMRDHVAMLTAELRATREELQALRKHVGWGRRGG